MVSRAICDEQNKSWRPGLTTTAGFMIVLYEEEFLHHLLLDQMRWKCSLACARLSRPRAEVKRVSSVDVLAPVSKHAQQGRWVQAQSRDRTLSSVPKLEFAERAESFPDQVL